jgi:uncharacterized protein YlzI (FlbEa/FlbD family)
MRDQRRVMIRGKRAVVFEKIQQVRHLLEVRGDVRVIAGEMYVVELNVDHVLDVSARRLQVALAAGTSLRLRRGRRRLRFSLIRK